MRHIVKRAPPASFDEWKAQGSQDWTPTYSNLQNPQKRDLHNALLEEQGWVCCYCGRRIVLNDSHLEHFRPREQRPDLELDYSNLHASCLRETISQQPLHCGHSKGSAFREDLHVSPLSADCERRFAYSLDGQQLAADNHDMAAQHMISLLNLNVAFLRNRRNEALQGAFDNTFLEMATDSDLMLLRDVYQLRDEEGRFKELSHVICRYAEQLLATMTRAL